MYRSALRHLRSTLPLLAGLSMAPATAAASGQPGDMAEAGFRLGRIYAGLRALRRDPDTRDILRTPDAVDAEIEAWRKKGLRDQTLIRDGEFSEHPEAKQAQIPFGLMTGIAQEYRERYQLYLVKFGLRAAVQTLKSIREGYVKPTEDLEASQIASKERDGNSTRCAELVALGRTLDPAMTIAYDWTLDMIEKEICPALAEHVPAWVATARASYRARRAKEAAPFVAAGITGEKLDLLVTYVGVSWRLPGGEKTDAPARLAKAPVLYQLLDSQDKDDPRYLIYTVRRYQFSGDRIARVSESQARRHYQAAVSDLFR